MTIEETCRQLKEEIDAKMKVEKRERKTLPYKVDHDSVMEALKFFNLIKT